LHSITLTADPRTHKPLHSPPASSPVVPEIIFNVSHQAGLVVLIAVPSTPPTSPSPSSLITAVGIDVVNTSERNDAALITTQHSGDFTAWVEDYKEVFSEHEMADLRERWAGDLKMQLRHFYARWALKEAYLKAMGEALLASWVREVEFRMVRVPKEVEGKQGEWGETVRDVQVWRGKEMVEGVEVELRARGKEWIIAVVVIGGGDRAEEGKGVLEGVEFEDVDVDAIGVA
jgi:4'-phosphopantetheinyl transferase